MPAPSQEPVFSRSSFVCIRLCLFFVEGATRDYAATAQDFNGAGGSGGGGGGEGCRAVADAEKVPVRDREKERERARARALELEVTLARERRAAAVKDLERQEVGGRRILPLLLL